MGSRHTSKMAALTLLVCSGVPAAWAARGDPHPAAKQPSSRPAAAPGGKVRASTRLHRTTVTVSKVTGPHGAAAVRREVLRLRPRLDRCGDVKKGKFMRRASGSLRLRLTITGSGKVRVKQLGATVRRAGVKACARRALAKLRLAARPGPAAATVIVRYSHDDHLVSIFGGDTALGADARGALGGLIGNQIGKAYGLDGLSSKDGSKKGTSVIVRVRLRHPTVTGTLPRGIIVRIVRRHVNELRYCYSKARSKNPKLACEVTVDFTLGGTGQVISTKVHSTTCPTSPDKQPETCIVRAIRRWKFPRSQGGGATVVRFPFVLTPLSKGP